MQPKRTPRKDSPCPRWDGERRELWLGQTLVKRFRRPAPVVERILTAFQEDGWPPHIDDPLAPLPGRREKERLRQAIHALNRRLSDRCLVFETDGHGLGVCWRRREALVSAEFQAHNGEEFESAR